MKFLEKFLVNYSPIYAEIISEKLSIRYQFYLMAESTAMKSTLITLFLFLCFSLQAHEQSPAFDMVEDENADQIVPDESEDFILKANHFIKVQTAKVTAKSILKKALSELTPEHKWHGYRNNLQKMKDIIENAEYLWPPHGTTYITCKKPGVLAFVKVKEVPQFQRIYICPNTFRNFSQHRKFAQVLIHEAAHVNEIYNECVATYYEYVAMMAGLKNLAYENNYMKPCNVRKIFEGKHKKNLHPISDADIIFN